MVEVQGVIHDGKHVKFEMKHDAEHDLMTPVYTLDAALELPVKEDSELAAVLE